MLFEKSRIRYTVYHKPSTARTMYTFSHTKSYLTYAMHGHQTLTESWLVISLLDLCVALLTICLTAEELLNLHRGQGLELQWRDSLQCPTEEEYIDVVDNSTLASVCLWTRTLFWCALTETSGLLRIAIKLMTCCATSNRHVYARLLLLLYWWTEITLRNYVPLVNLIGVYYQIRDDYMNLQSGEVCTVLTWSVPSILSHCHNF